MHGFDGLLLGILLEFIDFSDQAFYFDLRFVWGTAALLQNNWLVVAQTEVVLLD